MKKTLTITLEFPPTIGGIATYTHQLASHLDPKKTVVLAPLAPEAKDWDKKQKYKIIRTKMLYPIFIWPRWLRLCLQVWKIVKQEKIEMIMVHHVLPVGYVALMNKRFRKLLFIVFFHGADFTSAKSSTKWKQGKIRKVCHKAQNLVFNSEKMKEHFLSRFAEFESKAQVLYPAVDDSLFLVPNQEELEKLKRTYGLLGKKVLLSVSRIGEGKGYPHMLRLIKSLAKKVPNLVWLIVGDGPKSNYIIDFVQKHNLQNIVRFIGAVEPEKIKSFYYLADLFVLLTHPDEERGEESFGIVFLEAAAAGLPVVAGKTGGVSEAVLDGETGLIFDVYREANKIEEAIANLLSNGEEAKVMGERAKERVRNEFTWDRQVSKLEKML